MNQISQPFNLVALDDRSILGDSQLFIVVQGIQ
jgi:hypothetical protein